MIKYKIRIFDVYYVIFYNVGGLIFILKGVGEFFDSVGDCFGFVDL